MTSILHKRPAWRIPGILLAAFLAAGCFPTDEKPERARILPGIYETHLTLWEGPDTAFIYGRLELRADSSYFQQTYLTNAATEYDHEVAYEAKGRFWVEGDSVFNSNIRERTAQFSIAYVGPWEDPEEGATSSQMIRNITSGSFDAYDAESQTWNQWKRIADSKAPASVFNGVYTNNQRRFSLTFPEAWALGLDYPLGADTFLLSARKPHDGADPLAFPRVDIRQVAMSTGPLLAHHMSREIAWLKSLEVTVTDSSTQVVNSVTVGTVTGQYAQGNYSGIIRIRVFERTGFAISIIMEDRPAGFAPGKNLPAIDASLTFF